jgi:hypothetical protein
MLRSQENPQTNPRQLNQWQDSLTQNPGQLNLNLLFFLFLLQFLKPLSFKFFALLLPHQKLLNFSTGLQETGSLMIADRIL